MRKSLYNREVTASLAHLFIIRISKNASGWAGSKDMSEKNLQNAIMERLDRQREIILKMKKEKSNDDVIAATTRVEMKEERQLRRRRMRRSNVRQSCSSYLHI